MNRRSFLASLIAIPAGVAAAVGVCAQASRSRMQWHIDWSDIEVGKQTPPAEVPYRCVITPVTKEFKLRSITWDQHVQRYFHQMTPEERIDFLREKTKANIAWLKLQRPLPLR